MLLIEYSIKEVFIMGKKVMIVDDSAFTRAVIKDFVTEAGAQQIVEAADGQEAIDRYETELPDLVFLDIMMPNVNGLVALKTIMSKHKDARVVMFTSAQQEIIQKEALEAGALEFMPKPIRKEDIISIVARYLV
jgi:two-component system, chemotaxis family, chemotaxis protein CheY